jgi:hypothetical protein
VLLVAACTGRDNTPVAPPSFEATSSTPTISGQVLGPDGTSLCNSLPPGALVGVRVIDPVNATPATPFAGLQTLTCPNSAYAISVAPGTYVIRVGIPADPSIPALPFRSLTDKIVVADNVSRDIQLLDGIPLGGTATFDGAPVAGVGIDLSYTFPTALALFAGLGGVSGADGGWDDASPRSLMVQAGMTYQLRGCAFLGARVLNVVPNGSFLFPDQVSAINCSMTTAPSVAFSHNLPRLVVTPMPGDIGGQSRELFGPFGRGWGVQFPAGTAGPSHAQEASRLFLGGLLVGVLPNRILSGVDVGGYVQCGASCRDFGLDGTVSFKDTRNRGKRVTWRYSDAGSLERVGLQVVQHSFDGQLPNDYVLFQFIFTNTSTSTLTFYAGFFGDWDLNDLNGPGDDVGSTELDGHLMYVTNKGGIGVHVGTLLLGDFPISGTYFLGESNGMPLSDQFGALSGALTRTSFGPADIRAIHGMGPITLRPSAKTAEIWIAIVAGENSAQLLANAAAADADVTARQR